MKVRFCDQNKGKGKVLRRLQEEHPGIDAKIKKCLGICGPCAEQPVALVSGKKVKGRDGDDLYRRIAAGLASPRPMTDPACDFYCGRILTGQLSVPVYFENDRVFAFHHTNPLWENHVVLLPKKHIESLLTLEEADNDLLLELMRTARMIAGDFMARFGAARVYTNLGDYQSAKHLHWHIGAGPQLRPY
jgi:histidine triad (HIT) family protein